MLLRLFIFSLFLFINVFVQAQVNDNFSDANFTDNPVWLGDDSLWLVNTSLQLQSKGTTGTAKDIYLVTQNSLIQHTEWRLQIRFNFSPSTQNFCRYYLTADQTNLKSNLNGYYLQLGGSTGNTDTISLYKQEGSKRTRIIAGRPATVAKSNNILDIKVNRDSLGNWALYSDTTCSGNFVLEGTVYDNTFSTTSYTGFFARFTSGNASNFYLDNVYIGEPIVDINPPQLEGFELINDSALQLHYNEALESSAVNDLANFELNNNFPTIINTKLSNDLKNIVITFDHSFVITNSYVLRVKNMQDINHNTANDTSISFLFYKPFADDIVINEIIPDPSPSNGLPEAEFIELFNRSNYPIDISGWKINDLSTSATIPNFTIQPKAYVIICSPANENLFKPYGTTLAVTFLPGLNNDGDLVQLTTANNTLINQIKYDIGWYRSTSKKEGGWSLELINPYTLCKGADNWQASENTTGGTPGQVNSFHSLTPDTVKPLISKWFYTNDKNLVLVCNEKMDSLKMLNIKLRLNGAAVAPGVITVSRFDSVLITLNNAMVDRQTYALEIDSAFDCSMNKIADNTRIVFTYIPVKAAQQNDILITEIYATPKANSGLPNAEYLELYNRSSNIISLNHFKIKSGSTITGIENVQLYPDSFIAVCDDGDLPLFAAYKNVISVPTLPTLSLDDEIILYNENNYIIHQVAYKQSWFNNPVKADGGWSLEMIDMKNPCGLAANWAASKNTKGGTVGFNNSVKGISTDNDKLLVNRIYPAGPHTIEVYFNKTLDSLSACSKNIFGINPPLNGSFIFDFKDDYLSQLRITFADSLKQNQVYTIKADNVKDCAGNKIADENPLSFALCKPADSNDLAINELLFNPTIDGIDFVEIYNKSNLFLDVKNVFIANRNSSGLIDNFYNLSDSGYMLLPNSYYIVSTDENIIKQQYQVINTKNCIRLNNMPGFNDDAGTVVLFTKPERIFDELTYDDKMHFALLDNKEGVSLERIDFNRNTRDRNNWSSASSTSGFATPTYKNSQYLVAANKALALHIEPEIFTPNNDGINDIVNFTYKLDKNNYTGTIQVYNSNGTLVKSILNNAPLGAEGIITWNGLGDKNQALPVGIYIVYFDYFNTDGSSDSIKKTLIIGKSY